MSRVDDHEGEAGAADTGRPRVMLLGSGELGRELVVSFQRLGADVLEVPADAMGAGVVEAYLGIKREGSL